MPQDPSRERRHPIDQLARSHERLREQVAELVALGQATELDRNRLDALVAWFEGPGARHEADEEESLFPRLRVAATDDKIRALLHRLVDEHCAHTKLHAALAGVRTTAELARVSAAIAEAHRAHMELEERELFPAARQLLGARDFEAMSGEMEARRGRPRS